MATIDVKDATGATVAIEKPLTPGRVAATSSRPVALSNEDFAVLDGLEAALATLATHVDGLETLVTSTNTKLDTAITALQIIDNMTLAAGTANIGDVDVLSLPALPASANIIGTVKVANSAGTVVDPSVQVAHDAPDSGGGAPIKVGGRAKLGLSAETLVAADDRTNANFAADGAQFVRTDPYEDVVAGSASIGDGTATNVIAAAAAGIKTYLRKCSLSNSHATTSVIVDLVSGSTVRWTVNVPPGGRELNFDPPLPPNAAAEIWKFDPQGAGAATIYCSMLGVKSKV